MKAYKEVAKKYNVNAKALKRRIKSNERDINNWDDAILTLFIYAPDLMYCREGKFKGEVEYVDMELNLKLIEDMKKVNYDNATNPQNFNCESRANNSI